MEVVGGWDCKWSDRLDQEAPWGPAIFLRGKLDRGQAAKRAVRPELIVIFGKDSISSRACGRLINLCSLRHSSRMLPVEAFDVAVLGGFAWRDEAVGDLAVVGPAFQRQARKLRSVVVIRLAGRPRNSAM